MAFEGFVEADFAVFELPSFEARMPELRRLLTPKLKALAAELAPRLEAALGTELYPHVALHLRRTTNAPEATWAAFSPSRRSYKPYTHYRIAVHARGIRVTVFEEDSSEERARFAKALAAQARAATAFLRANEGYGLFESGKRSATYPGSSVSEEIVREVAGRVLASPHGHLSIGVDHHAGDARLRSAASFLDLAAEGAHKLHPFFRLGGEADYKL